jgi:hypothetical protein
MNFPNAYYGRGLSPTSVHPRSPWVDGSSHRPQWHGPAHFPQHRQPMHQGNVLPQHLASQYMHGGPDASARHRIPAGNVYTGMSPAINQHFWTVRQRMALFMGNAGQMTATPPSQQSTGWYYRNQEKQQRFEQNMNEQVPWHQARHWPQQHQPHHQRQWQPTAIPAHHHGIPPQNPPSNHYRQPSVIPQVPAWVADPGRRPPVQRVAAPVASPAHQYRGAPAPHRGALAPPPRAEFQDVRVHLHGWGIEAFIKARNVRVGL